MAREMMLGTRHAFEYLECADCGTVQISNVPENLADYYGPGYYSLVDRSDTEAVSLLRRFLRRQRASYALGRPNPLGWLLERCSAEYFDYSWDWFRDTGCSTASKILDVGCGHGALLKALHAKGFRALHGVDPFLKEPLCRRGLEIVNCSVFDVDEQFDLVMSHHSFEHVAEPRRFLQQIRQLCRPLGYILIRMPVLGASWREFDVNWFELDAPRHLWIPTVAGLVGMIESAGGMEITRISFDSTPAELWQSEMYKRDIPMLDRGIGGRRTAPSEVFSAVEMAQFERTIRIYNDSGQAGRAVFVIRRLAE